MNDSKFYWHTHFAGGTVNSRDSCEDELSSKIELEAINEIWLSLRDIYFSEYTLLRVYANAHSFGLDGSIHRDNSPSEDGISAIVYVHQIWCLPWAGELVLYSNDHSEIIKSIIPAPGRLVIFPGSVPHAARSPSRECNVLRLSLVFKAMKIK